MADIRVKYVRREATSVLATVTVRREDIPMARAGAGKSPW